MPTTTHLMRSNDWSLMDDTQWMMMGVCLIIGIVIAVWVERVGKRPNKWSDWRRK